MNYKLYLVLPQNIPTDAEFYLITARYCLCYTNGEAPQGAKEIKKVSNLPELAVNWISECIDTIRIRAMEEQKDMLLSEAAPVFHEALRNALEQESDALKRQENGGE